MFGRKCRILQRCFALFLMVCLLIPSVPVLAVTDTTENSETTEEVSLMTEEGNSSEERSRVLYDVSAIYENGEANTSHTLVDQTDATYGEILAEAGLTDALLSKNTTVLYYFVTETGNDITAYEEEGALYFKIWSDKASVCTMELGSLSTPDDRELQWGTVSLEAGWNEVILKMSSGAKQGNAMDLENVIRMRFFSLNQADTYLISDITIGQTAYLPGNTTGSAETDVAIAVDAIKSNLAVDDQGSYTIDVRVADSDTDAEVQQKIINALEESITAWTRNTDNIYNVEITVSCTEKENAIICAMMDEVKQEITVKPNLIYYEKMQVQVVDSVYAGDEVITAAIVLGQGDYALDNTGAADCTAVIQSALDDCADAGGGVVWLPAGYYRVTGMLRVPTYVTLRGDWQDPDTVSSTSELEYGTILVADLSQNTPLVYVSGSAGVEGLTIYYLNQSMANVQENAYAIYNEGYAFSKADALLHTIKNCTIINAYKGIGICDSLYITAAGSEQTYVYNVKGTFLNTGFYNYNASDNGGTIGFTAKADYWADFTASPAYEKICENLHLTKTSVSEEEIRSYTREGGIGLHIGDLEGDFFTDITIEGYQYGVQVDQGARTTYYGDLYHLDISDCEVGIQFNKLSGFGVNVASSRFYNNTTDIVNNTSAQVKLADVTYTTISGNTVYTTSDNAYTERITGYTELSYGVTARKLNVFTYDADSELTLTGQLQAALDEVGAAGGGVVYLPAGHYVLETAITVPANTELRGCAGSAVRPSKYIEGGTVLEVYFGQNSADSVADAAIILNGKNAGVSGLILNFPPQTVNEPMTSGYGIVGKEAEGAFVVNCSVLGFSHGIYVENCNDYVINGVLFTCFQNNITAKNCAGGSISCCLQNTTPLVRNTYDYPTWWEMESGTDTATFRYTASYLDCIILDGSTEQMVYHWYAYRPHDTITLRNGAEVTAFNYGAGGLDGETVGVLITAETADCSALSVNSHQKYRYTVEAAAGADVQVYNRLTLEGSTLVSVEDSYRSVGADDYTLVEPGVSLLSTKAISDGYDLSKGGTISYEINYEEYSVAYDFSEYKVLAVDFADTAAASNDNFVLQLNGNKVSFNIAEAGKQTIYIAMEHFDEDLSQVMISSFAFEADSEVSSCKVSSIRLLKELPEGAELTEVGNGIKQKTNLVNADSAVSTNFTVVPVSEAPEATESISTTNIWEATAAQPVCAVSFDAVNIKSYMEDGYIHFYLYVPEGAENTGYVLELSSSGKSDSQELQFNFGRNNGYYDMNLTAGWNEIWLPIAGGSATGYIDFSAVNYVRFFAAAATETAYTYYVDGFEIVHREYVDEGVVENDDADMLWETAEDLTRAGGNGEPQFIELTEYGKTGYGILNVAAAAGTYQYARYSINEVQHLADYSGGYLHMSVYVEDEEALQGLGSLIMEISSRGASDTHEIQWAINAANTQLEAGWNEIYLPLTKAYYNMGSGGYLDLNRVNYFRLFFTGNTEAVDLILADMYVTMTCPESVDEGTLIEVGITKTTPEAPAVTGSYDAAIDDETFTYTVDAIEGAQYRMDEGEWQDCNIFENIEPESTHVFEARVKGTKYVRTGKVGSSGEVVFDKLQQNAPNSFTLTFALNKDGKTYTATIPAVENALYSFDGVTYSAENTKTDCQQGSSYTGYIKYAATVTYDESEAVTDTQTAPVLEDEKDDEDTPDTPGTENGGGSNGTSGTENGGNTTDTSGTGNSGSNTDGGSTTITGTVSNAGTNANANTNASVSDSASPETGDTSVSILAVAVIAILGIALIAISYCYKKKKEA